MGELLKPRHFFSTLKLPPRRNIQPDTSPEKLLLILLMRATENAPEEMNKADNAIINNTLRAYPKNKMCSCLFVIDRVSWLF
jgi:hypothetical protein